MDWDGTIPAGVTPITGAGSAGASVVGGMWEDEPAATEEPKPALPDPFAY